MSKAVFRQADLLRVLKAASQAGAIVQMDMKTLIVTIFPAGSDKLVDEEGNPLGSLPQGNWAPDGEEHWGDD